MASGQRFVNPAPAFYQDNRDPVVGGSLYFYVAGTLTLQNTYSDSALTIPNSNPVVLDAYGRAQSDIFLDTTLSYRCVLKDSDQVVVFDKNILSGADIAVAVAAHNADLGAHYAATETQRGFSELANSAEAIAGLDTGRTITPATLKQVFENAPHLQMAGSIDEYHGPNVASAATVDLNAITVGNLIDITGSVTITAITLRDGASRTLRFTGTPILTNSASLVLPGGSNITAAAGDFLTVRGYAAGIVRAVAYLRADRVPGASPVTFPSTALSLIGDTTIALPAGAWRRLKLVISGLTSATNYVAFLQMNADTANNYDYTQLSMTSAGQTDQSSSTRGGIAVTLIATVGGSGCAMDAEFDLIRPTSAALKEIGIRSRLHDGAGTFRSVFGDGFWRSSAAITSLTFLLRGSSGATPTGATVSPSAGSYYFVGEL